MAKPAVLALLICGLPLQVLAGVVGPSDCIDNQRQSIASGGTNGVAAVFAVDLNGDTFIDVLSASTNDDKILWFRSDGGNDPTFEEQRPITTNADGVVAIAAADLDDDGDVDVVSASSNDDTIAWYENLGGLVPNFIERAIATDADNATALFIGDIDLDGDLDVASASSVDDKIAWYENDLDEHDPKLEQLIGFTPHVVSTAADAASSVFAADLRPFQPPQGKEEPEPLFLELISASRVDDKIAWYERVDVEEPAEGEPDYAWVEHVVDVAADGASSVFAATIDSDEHIDIIAASANDDRISWYESDGMIPPSFTKHVIAAEADGASAVIAANLDGDLDMDVLSASSRDGTIAWYENLGDGTFGEREIITADADGATGLFAIDLDQDGGGTVDVIAASSVAGEIAANDLIAWHENTGLDPMFDTHEISRAAIAPSAILVEQVDGLGGVDVIAASSVDATIYWFENDGLTPPGFTQHEIDAMAGDVADMAWADLGGTSGAPDLIVALSEADTIAWYDNLGGGSFGERVDISPFNADGASSVFADDIDGDGNIDILATSINDNRVALYLNNGDGSFEFEILTDQADEARSVVAGDIDGDDDLDVVAVSSGDNAVRWFENDGMMPPSFTEHFITDAGGLLLLNQPYDVALADMDLHIDLEMADDTDVVVANSGGSRVVWFKQFTIVTEDDPETPEDESATEIGWAVQIIPVAALFARTVLLEDLDEDGDTDIVSVAAGQDTVRWLQSPVEQTVFPEKGEELPEVEPFIPFTERSVTTTAENIRDVAVGDVDNDGFDDIVTAFLFEIAWHSNDAVEICADFDVEGGPEGHGDGDGRVDGQELSLLGAAFGWACPDPEDPPADEPRLNVDYTDDCVIDGNDLAILTSIGVWGNTTENCSFTCP